MGTDTVDDALTDVDGYLIDGDAWTVKKPFALASSAGISRLTEDHWKIITALRGWYSSGKPDWFPQMSGICNAIDLKTGCVHSLFGDLLIVWQIAALPKPAIGISAQMPDGDLVVDA